MLKKIGHITLAFVLLASTVGLTINLHYCKDKLYDVGLFTEAKNCCKDKEHQHTSDIAHEHKHHNHSCDSENHKPSDCEDETIKIESVDNYVVSTNTFTVTQDYSTLLFPVYFVVVDLFKLSEVRTTSKIPKSDISPPEIQVVLSLLQTYLL